MSENNIPRGDPPGKESPPYTSYAPAEGVLGRSRKNVPQKLSDYEKQSVWLDNVDGLDLKVCTGQNGWLRPNKPPQNQTFNLRRNGSKDRKYEVEVKNELPMRPQELMDFHGHKFADAEEMAAYLMEFWPAEVREAPWLSQPETAAIALGRPLSEWEQKSAEVIEQVIDEFVNVFMQDLYLYRKETSWYGELFAMLRSDPCLSEKHPLKDPRCLSQPLHLAWPRSAGEGRQVMGRGDISVLSPEALLGCSRDDFLIGKPRPSFIIEAAFGHGCGHLSDDYRKLAASGAARGYVVHLVRKKVDCEELESLLLKPNFQGIKTAYARETVNGFVFKRVNGTELDKKP